MHGMALRSVTGVVPKALRVVRSLAFLCLTGCHTAAPALERESRAASWTLYAAEYDATTTTVFAAAAEALPRLLADPGWTAALEQDGGLDPSKAPAVILDIDDTLLGTGAYQRQLAERGQSYDAASWDAWVRRREAPAIAGAVDYVERARALGLTVLLVSNRACRARAASASPCPQREDTIENLVLAGFSRPGPEQLLLQGMQPDWLGDKTSRRSYVAARYRVIQLIGDDLGDFIAGDGDAQQRDELVRKYRRLWGKGWFMLPNPMYGSWQASLPAR